MATSHGWYAWYNHMPGNCENRDILRVTGNLVLDGGGYEVELTEGNIGVVPEPGLFALQLSIVPPSGVGTTVLTTVPVRWEGTVPGISTVRVQGLDVPVYIPVEIVH